MTRYVVPLLGMGIATYRIYRFGTPNSAWVALWLVLGTAAIMVAFVWYGLRKAAQGAPKALFEVTCSCGESLLRAGPGTASEMSFTLQCPRCNERVRVDPFSNEGDGGSIVIEARIEGRLRVKGPLTLSSKGPLTRVLAR